MEEKRKYTFSTTDGLLARFDGAAFPDLWREESGRWEIYYDVWEFGHNSHSIDEAEAKRIIGDGDLYAPTFYPNEQPAVSVQAAVAAQHTAG